ncbi:MAG: cell division protein FtsZ [Candidatus Methanoperedens sp.]|nr:cell division protein FtsZ [Candidatus Methanoperedens sp.]MCZ7396043.1 cell division protein FtsZ [Candidatus Methanoperedens sp.]
MTLESRISELAKAAKPTVAIIGLGGAGCNIVSWIAQKEILGSKIIAADTDAAHLLASKADAKILMGEKAYQGKGCGGFAERGIEAARESIKEIQEELVGSNLVFIIAGMGGGSGTGAAPVVAEATREAGILTIGCVMLPFSYEVLRRKKGISGIKALAAQCDSLVVIDNSRLRTIAGSLPLREGFAVANEFVGNFIKNITETITQASLVNLDYSDLRSVVERGGISAIGIGDAEGENRIEKAVEQALSTPLLDVSDISGAYGVLIHIAGGEDMTLGEVTQAGEIILQKAPNTGRIVWGAKVDDSLAGHVRVTAVLTCIMDPDKLT